MSGEHSCRIIAEHFNNWYPERLPISHRTVVLDTYYFVELGLMKANHVTVARKLQWTREPQNCLSVVCQESITQHMFLSRCSRNNQRIILIDVPSSVLCLNFKLISSRSGVIATLNGRNHPIQTHVWRKCYGEVWYMGYPYYRTVIHRINDNTSMFSANRKRFRKQCSIYFKLLMQFLLIFSTIWGFVTLQNKYSSVTPYSTPVIGLNRAILWNGHPDHLTLHHYTSIYGMDRWKNRWQHYLNRHILEACDSICIYCIFL